MKIAKPILIVVLLSFISCDKESHEPTRTFYMGFTPFPYAVSLEALDFTYNKIEEAGDIINHHFDNGVPWVEAFGGQEFHENVMNDWNYRKQNIPPGHKVYVSVSALSIERTGLARYRGETDDMPLPAPWNTYRFNDEEVKLAYLSYCKRIIAFFNPDYFNMCIEANLLYFENPELWSDFLNFHQFVYSELKKEFPALPVFSSVTGTHMLSGFYPGNDHIQQRLAVLQIIDNSDLYALSLYPYLSGYLGNPFPETTLDELLSLSGKPVAIAETGYPAQSFVINTSGTEVSIASDIEKQNRYITTLLQACEKRKAVFVINFTVRDYDELWASLGGKNDLTIAWRDIGLYDETGAERPALITWKDYRRRSLGP
jgi:hypothetical protein